MSGAGIMGATAALAVLNAFGQASSACSRNSRYTNAWQANWTKPPSALSPKSRKAFGVFFIQVEAEEEADDAIEAKSQDFRERDGLVVARQQWRRGMNFLLNSRLCHVSASPA